MKKICLIIILITLISGSMKSQILDVPYRSDNSGCGLWCWAKSAHMTLVYYGNDIYLCDVLEFVRQSKPSLYNTSNCCVEPDSCCSYGYLHMTSSSYPNSVNQILNNWSIATTIDYSYLTTVEIQTELTNNRPFIIMQERYNPILMRSGYHALVAYGYLSGDIYLQDPGNGSKIIDYNDYLILGTDNIRWVQTLLMNSSAATCPLTQHIIGRIKGSQEYGNIYKAQQDIYASCIIEPTASVEFICGDEINLEAGFRVDNGGSVIFKSGSTVICP